MFFPGSICPGHIGHRYVLAAGPQRHLERDGTLPLCLHDHGIHVGKEPRKIGALALTLGEESQTFCSGQAPGPAGRG
jgi:hypothetical protein